MAIQDYLPMEGYRVKLKVHWRTIGIFSELRRYYFNKIYINYHFMVIFHLSVSVIKHMSNWYRRLLCYFFFSLTNMLAYNSFEIHVHQNDYFSCHCCCYQSIYTFSEIKKNNDNFQFYGYFIIFLKFFSQVYSYNCVRYFHM